MLGSGMRLEGWCKKARGRGGRHDNFEALGCKGIQQQQGGVVDGHCHCWLGGDEPGRSSVLARREVYCHFICLPVYHSCLDMNGF